MTGLRYVRRLALALVKSNDCFQWRCASVSISSIKKLNTDVQSSFEQKMSAKQGGLRQLTACKEGVGGRRRTEDLCSREGKLPIKRRCYKIKDSQYHRW